MKPAAASAKHRAGGKRRGRAAARHSGHRTPMVLLGRMMADRLAFMTLRRRKVIGPLLCGLAMAWPAYAAVAGFPTVLTQWAPAVAIGLVILAWANARVAVGATAAVCAIQMLLVHPQLGLLTAVLGALLVGLSLISCGRVCVVLLAPYLTALGLGIMAPLGLGLASRRRSGWVWATLAFCWCVIHAVPFGEPHLGIAGSEYAGGLLEQSGSEHAADDQAEEQSPPAGLTVEWLRWAASSANLKGTTHGLLPAAVEDAPKGLIVCQLALWAGVAWLAGALFVRKRAKDKLAMAYIEKLTHRSGTSKQRKLISVMIMCAVAFIVGYVVLGIVFADMEYGPYPGAALDLVAAGLLFLVLYVALEGDPEAGKVTLREMRLAAADKKGRPHSRGAGDAGVWGALDPEVRDRSARKRRP